MTASIKKLSKRTTTELVQRHGDDQKRETTRTSWTTEEVLYGPTLKPVSESAPMVAPW